MTIFASLIFLSNLNFQQMPPMSKNYVFILILVYLVVLIVSFVNLLNHNFETLSKNKALENKILTAQLQIKDQELQYLKKQIHPHFLFNTLNTIYGLALKQSKRTPEIILKLSNLLDYILYQINKPKVTLREEILHIKEYIELEKIRFQDTLLVTYTSDKIPDEIQIAPMLLIPFVENAFKHGNLIEGFLKVNIEIRISNNKFTFRIKNTVIKDDTEANQNGLGLENIKKRLDLLYHNNHELILDQSDNWYEVKLSILNISTNRNV
jgi:sensor histidine kinase YesM